MGSSDEYINLQPLMWQLQQVQNLNAMNCFLLFVKVFKYVAVIPQMNLLFATLSKAGLDLLFFSAVFVIVVTGFAMAFYLAFGLDVEDYSSVPKSLLALFQLLLGIFDYDALWRSNRVLSPLLFVSFVVLVVFILMNIFLAIINDAFSVVNEQQRGSGSVSDMLRNLFMKKVLKKNVEEMLDDLAGGVNLHDKEGLAKALDMDGDNQLDAGEVSAQCCLHHRHHHHHHHHHHHRLLPPSTARGDAPQDEAVPALHGEGAALHVRHQRRRRARV